MIKWGEKVPENALVDYSSFGHKDDWATIVCDEQGWWHAWEYPHQRKRLKECLDSAGELLEDFLQRGKEASITICQI